jgi:putative transposase
MSRPQRILYENAYYHVMNRGAGWQMIFHDELYYEAFLRTIQEAHIQFGIEIHAYCLMGNHYHLLIKTPRGNLSRAMRHINGIYTQRYNRLTHTDGALFRGRYHAILIDSDSYLLHLSKYIHLNPLAALLVNNLEEYRWSSYPAYINQAKSPGWLIRKEVYEQITTSSEKAKYYRLFMNDGQHNEVLEKFYSKQRLTPVLGDETFISQLKLSEPSSEIPRQACIRKTISISNIINAVSNEFDEPYQVWGTQPKGVGRKNMAKKVAMYIAQKHGDYLLKEIAKAFGLNHYGGVSHAIHCVKNLLETDSDVAVKIHNIINRLDP